MLPRAMRLLLGFALLLIATAAHAADPWILVLQQQARTMQSALAASQPPSPSAGEASGPPQGEPGSGQRKTTADQRGPDASPLFVNVLSTPKAEKEARKDAEEQERKAATDRWMIVLTGAVAVATFLQVCVLYIAIRTTRRQLRAYVQVDINPNSTIAVDPTQIATLPVSIKNSGQTPAYKVEINARILPYDYPLIGELPDVPKSRDEGRTVIHPGQALSGQVAADRLWNDAD